MKHSVKYIGETYEAISIKRKDINQFNANDFYIFANNNRSKYNLIVNGDDLLVSTWFSDKLIDDYKITLWKK